MLYFIEARHRTKKSELQAIYAKYKNDWLPNQGTTYPTIWTNFPKTIGYGMFHKVIFVVDGDDTQIRNLSNLFFGLMKLTLFPLYDIMSEAEVDALPDE